MAAGHDPYKLSDEVRSIVVSHGGTYADILPDYRGVPNPEQVTSPRMAIPMPRDMRPSPG